MTWTKIASSHSLAPHNSHRHSSYGHISLGCSMSGRVMTTFDWVLLCAGELWSQLCNSEWTRCCLAIGDPVGPGNGLVIQTRP